MIQEQDGIYKTVAVSYPRSGQSLIQPVLSEYFGTRFHYCEWYNDKEKRPNVCAETNFVKTHDRDLAWHIRDDWKYLVLIRHPLFAVNSWKRFDQEDGDYNVGWKLDFWAKFTTRWVVNDVPNRKIVFFESMISNPLVALSDIILFLDATSTTVNLPLLESLISKYAIGPRHNHTKEWLGYV